MALTWALSCLWIALVLEIFFTGYVRATEEIVVDLDAGKVRGTTMKTAFAGADGEKFYAFLGIPYAEPPIEELRFKPPVPKAPWKDSGEILDATKEAPVCAQIDFLTHSLMGREDCLYLNVYTPKVVTEGKATEKYPVFVFIHGGAFKAGFASSWLYGPHKFMDKGVVFVAMNYRLEALGFMSTEDEHSTGNYGLLDQRAALQWVQANIGAFGGDSDKVTLVGHSAGSASVLYHLISPLSKGLFHKAIAMSGSPLCSWAFSSNPLRSTKKLAALVKCPVTSSSELVKCLRKVPPQKLAQAGNSLSKDSFVTFVPTVDGHFLTGNPEEILAQKRIASKIPVMIGITRDEGAGLYAFINSKLGKYSEDFLKFNVRSALSNSEGDSPEVLRLIKEKYFKSEEPKSDIEAAKSLAKMYSDSMIDVSHYQTIKYLLEAGFDIYTYSFDFVPENSIIKFFGISENLGVAHGDELPILFLNKFFAVEVTKPAGKAITQRITDLFANFTKFGNPTPDGDVIWPKSTKPTEIQLYHIDEPASVSVADPFVDPRMNFWLEKIPQTLKLKGAVKEEL